MQYWTYQTSVGTFWIKPNKNNRFTLGVNDEALGSYHSPHQAADDVFMCATGYWKWDNQLTVNDPTDLSEWTLHKKR